MSKNRWELDDGIKEKVKTMVTDYITNCEVTEKLNLSEFPVGPYHIEDMLEKLGYEEIDSTNEGWEMNYWFHLEHSEDDDNFPPLCLFGTAILHEMYLRKEED